MAETTDSQEPKDDEKPFVRMKREDIQALEAAGAEAKQIPELQKELAMVKAGIATDSALGKMFFKSYEGDLSTEAVKAAALEIGLLTVETKAPEIPESERTSTQERQTVANGASAPDAFVKPAKMEAREEAERVVKEGGTYEQGAAGFINTLVKRYQDGDKSAVIDPRDRFQSR